MCSGKHMIKEAALAWEARKVSLVREASWDALRIKPCGRMKAARLGSGRKLSCTYDKGLSQSQGALGWGWPSRVALNCGKRFGPSLASLLSDALGSGCRLLPRDSSVSCQPPALSAVGRMRALVLKRTSGWHTTASTPEVFSKGVGMDLEYGWVSRSLLGTENGFFSPPGAACFLQHGAMGSHYWCQHSSRETIEGGCYMSTLI